MERGEDGKARTPILKAPGTCGVSNAAKSDDTRYERFSFDGLIG